MPFVAALRVRARRRREGCCTRILQCRSRKNNHVCTYPLTIVACSVRAGFILQQLV